MEAKKIKPYKASIANLISEERINIFLKEFDLVVIELILADLNNKRTEYNQEFYSKVTEIGGKIINLIDEHFYYYVDIKKFFNWLKIDPKFFEEAPYKNLVYFQDFIETFKREDMAFTIVFKVLKDLDSLNTEPPREQLLLTN